MMYVILSVTRIITELNFFHTIKRDTDNLHIFGAISIDAMKLLFIKFPLGNAGLFSETYPLCLDKHEDFQADLS